VLCAEAHDANIATIGKSPKQHLAQRFPLIFSSQDRETLLANLW
jgi:hypothetical protein